MAVDSIARKSSESSLNYDAGSEHSEDIPQWKICLEQERESHAIRVDGLFKRCAEGCRMLAKPPATLFEQGDSKESASHSKRGFCCLIS